MTRTPTRWSPGRAAPTTRRSTSAAPACTRAASFDFETKSSYSIRVRTTDAGGLLLRRGLHDHRHQRQRGADRHRAVGRLGRREQPRRHDRRHACRRPIPTPATRTPTRWSPAPGDTDNASFNIVGASAAHERRRFDFETKSSYSVRVRTTDAGGLFFEKAFTITVTNVNEAPTDIALSADIGAPRTAAPNTIVGTLSTTDPDAGDTHTYTLVAGTGDTDNASFTIAGTSAARRATLRLRDEEQLLDPRPHHRRRRPVLREGRSRSRSPTSTRRRAVPVRRAHDP